MSHIRAKHNVSKYCTTPEHIVIARSTVNPTMETPPSFKIDQDKDIISALPDELLLGILERLSLGQAVRAGAVSTRWRHLPHQLSRLYLDVDDFHGTTPLKTMDAFTGATRRLLSPAESKCDFIKIMRTVKTLHLRFYPSAPHLISIGHAVEDTVSRGQTDWFKFELIQPSSDQTSPRQPDWRRELGQQFMSFSRACPIAFRWLTGLSLKRLEFRNSDLSSLIGACVKLKHLSLIHCRLVWRSVLKIDVPSSSIQELDFIKFRCTRIDLVSVPKLTRLMCNSWRSKNAPLSFGYVPMLHTVTLGSRAKAWQSRFTLSECFSRNASSMSKLYLNFSCQMIWIQPEHPKQLSAIFRNLTDVALCCIFPECDMSWTLFILEAAPALQIFTLNRARHSCVKTSEDSAEKTNVVWEPSKNLKHLNLKVLVILGFEDEEKVANYIRLVMERATRLWRIELQSYTCKKCNKLGQETPRTSQGEDKDSRRRIKERLTIGPSLSVDIIIC
ncbi:unnamed protein product [Alopecurus aequalis]